VRSLQDHIAFIINIYQHNKFFHSLSFLPLKKFRIYENIKIVEILLALIWVGSRGDYKIQNTDFCQMTDYERICYVDICL
jgi:hypothetical protein